MIENPTFRVSFHDSHPSIPASEIEQAFGVPTNFSQSVGAERTTKSGKRLGGTYKVTSVSFRLSDPVLSFESVDIIIYIKELLSNLDNDYLEKLTQSGGSCDLLAGVFSSENVMFELTIEILSMLASSNISLKIDFYGG